jgi:hypothetical protein
VDVDENKKTKNVTRVISVDVTVKKQESDSEGGRHGQCSSVGSSYRQRQPTTPSEGA